MSQREEHVTKRVRFDLPAQPRALEPPEVQEVQEVPQAPEVPGVPEPPELSTIGRAEGSMPLTKEELLKSLRAFVKYAIQQKQGAQQGNALSPEEKYWYLVMFGIKYLEHYGLKHRDGLRVNKHCWSILTFARHTEYARRLQSALDSNQGAQQVAPAVPSVPSCILDEQTFLYSQHFHLTKHVCDAQFPIDKAAIRNTMQKLFADMIANNDPHHPSRHNLISPLYQALKLYHTACNDTAKMIEREVYSEM